MKEDLIRAESTVDQLTQKLADQKRDLEEIQKKFSSEFENLAQKILETKSEKFTKQNKENLDHLLKPLQEKLKSLKKELKQLIKTI